MTSLSDAVKLIVEVGWEYSAGGLEVIVVRGGPVSTIHVAVAGDGSMLPASSLAATETVCGPSARPV